MKNATPILEQEMDRYFRSILDSFRTSARMRITERPKEMSGYRSMGQMLLVMLGFTPIVPAIVNVISAIWHRVGGSGSQLSNAQFNLLWIVQVLVYVGSLIVFVMVRDRRYDLQNILPLSKLRFAYCYALADAIERYRKTQLEEHYKVVVDYWENILGLLAWSFNPFISPYENARSLKEQPNELSHAPLGYASANPDPKPFFQAVEFLSDTFPWFNVSGETQETMNAFASLKPRLSGRLKDRKDLRQLIEVLQSLAAYFFLAIPDLPEALEIIDFNFEDASHEALKDFATKLAVLSEYQSEIPVISEMPTLFTKIRIAFLYVTKPLSNDTLAIRFGAWWVLTQFFVVLAFKTWTHFHPVRFDSTILALVVGSPFALAAALSGAKHK